MSEHRSIRDAVWACRAIGATAKMVALRLVEHWPRVFPSVASLSEWTGLSERTVQRAIRELEDAEILVVTHRVGSSSAYSFTGVSIPDLGRPVMTGDTVTPPSESHPRHSDTPGVTESHPPPVTVTPPGVSESHPKQITLSGSSKQTREADRIAREGAPPKKRPPPGGSSPFALPDDFAPDVTAEALAERLGVSLREELPAFCDHHRARRNRFVDWQAALRTWIRNSAKWDKPKSGPRARAPDTPLQRQADRVQMLREQEAEEERRKAAGGGK